MNTSTLHPKTSTPTSPARPDPIQANEKPALALSPTALAAGALAAVTSAVVGSHLGTAGTLAGAGLGSVIGAVATALYSFGLERTRHALGALTPRRAKVVVGVLASALLAFVVSLGLITGFEQATGSALSGGSGTTVQQARVAVAQRQTDPAPEAAPPAEPAPVAPTQAAPTPVETSPSSAAPAPSESASAHEPVVDASSSPEPTPSAPQGATVPTTAPAATAPAAITH